MNKCLSLSLVVAVIALTGCQTQEPAVITEPAQSIPVPISEGPVVDTKIRDVAMTHEATTRRGAGLRKEAYVDVLYWEHLGDASAQSQMARDNYTPDAATVLAHQRQANQKKKAQTLGTAQKRDQRDRSVYGDKSFYSK